VLASDWKELGCGMYNTETKTCVQINRTTDLSLLREGGLPPPSTFPTESLVSHASHHAFPPFFIALVSAICARPAQDAGSRVALLETIPRQSRMIEKAFAHAPSVRCSMSLIDSQAARVPVFLEPGGSRRSGSAKADGLLLCREEGDGKIMLIDPDSGAEVEGLPTRWISQPASPTAACAA
jgi:hypothetical protein